MADGRSESFNPIGAALGRVFALASAISLLNVLGHHYTLFHLDGWVREAVTSVREFFQFLWSFANPVFAALGLHPTPEDKDALTVIYLVVSGGSLREYVCDLSTGTAIRLRPLGLVFWYSVPVLLLYLAHHENMLLAMAGYVLLAPILRLILVPIAVALLSYVGRIVRRAPPGTPLVGFFRRNIAADTDAVRAHGTIASVVQWYVRLIETCVYAIGIVALSRLLVTPAY